MKKFQTAVSLGIVLSLVVALAGPIAEIALATAVTGHRTTLSRLAVDVNANHEWRFVSPAGVDATTDTIIYEFDVPGTAFDLTGVLFTDIDLLEDTDATPGDCAGSLAQENLVSTNTAATNEWLVTIDTAADRITVGPATVGDTGATTAANACIILRVGTNAVSPSTGVNQINNPTVAGSYRMGVSGTFGNTGQTAVQIIANDQVAATAVVDATISFSISDPSITFGTLTTANARFATTTAGSATETTAHTMSASTNATHGYVIMVSGTTLTSGSNTITEIGATPMASSPNSEQFGIRGTATGTGSGTVTAPYNTANYALVLTPNQFASAPGVTAVNTFSLIYIANIGPVTEAGSYTSTLTYAANATF